MYYTSDLEYMRKELKFSLSTIDYIQKKYGDELSDEHRTRIMQLVNVLKELNIDIKYINQNPEILNCIDIYTEEEFIEILNYIKKVAKKKSPNLALALFIIAQQIVKNNRQNEIEQIINLLEKEGLSDILDNKNVNTKLLEQANYMVMYNNIQALSQVKTYKTIIRKNPQIIFEGTTSDIQKIVNKIKELETTEKEAIEQIHNENDNQKDYQENNLHNLADIGVDETNKKDGELNPYEDDNAYSAEEGKVLLGREDNVLRVIKAFKQYNMPYNVIFVNPDICRRKKIAEIESILKLLYDNDIPFNILEHSPKILQVGKSREMLEIIRYLKSQNINLDILCVCPEILTKSNVKKIQNILDVLEKESLSRNLIYSCPQVLISGNVKIFLEMKNELETSVPDINIILDMAPYVFVEKIANMATILDNRNSDLVNRSYLSNSNRVVIVKNVDESQKVINVLREENMSLDSIKTEPRILTRTSAKQTKDILTAVNELDIDKKLVEDNLQILVYSSAMAIREITSELKEYRPIKYKDIITAVPDVYIKSDSNKIDNIMKIFEREDLNYVFIDNNPTILIREDEQEIEQVSKKLKSKGFTSEQIESVPQILIEGKSKYVDRNMRIFEKNKMELPLCPAYTMKTRKLERNIDTLIENGLYQYIQPNPDILNIEPNTLVTYVTLAEIYGIPLVINKSKEEGHTINKQYLNSSREELEEKYGISRDVIQKVEAKVERKRDRKIKNVELYNKIYHILEEQADICLEQYKKDEVSYTKNDKIVSKQRLIRETYLDLEEAYDKKGKIAIKEFKANEKLDKKLDSLTKKKSGELKKKGIPEQAQKKEIIIEKGE